MPSIPKWLGNTMEIVSSKYYHAVEVTAVEYLTGTLKKVRFEGDLTKTSFTAGNVIEFRVNATDYRHYTPSVYDAAQGICEVIFYLHDQGSGSKWAEQLKTGDKIKLIGPGGRMKYLPEYTHHFVFGDETSISLMNCMENEAEKKQQFFFGLIEMKKEHSYWIDLLESSLIKPIESTLENPANQVISMLSGWEQEFWESTEDICFYLTGRAKSIQALRKFLLEKGIFSKQIKTDPYWSEGKKGL